MAITVNDKDLGMVTAYAYALAGGYTGTEAEFEALLGKIAEDLAEIENLSVQVQTLPAGSDATASYAEGVLTLGIPRGDKGETGDQGEIGPTPQLSVGAVTTGEPGTDAEVEITGTPEAPVLNFTIPRGDTGNITQAVRYDAAQTLTDAEKEQARANIDAADAGEVADLKSALMQDTAIAGKEYTQINITDKVSNTGAINTTGVVDSSVTSMRCSGYIPLFKGWKLDYTGLRSGATYNVLSFYTEMDNENSYVSGTPGQGASKLISGSFVAQTDGYIRICSRAAEISTVSTTISAPLSYQLKSLSYLGAELSGMFTSAGVASYVALGLLYVAKGWSINYKNLRASSGSPVLSFYDMNFTLVTTVTGTGASNPISGVFVAPSDGYAYMSTREPEIAQVGVVITNSVKQEALTVKYVATTGSDSNTGSASNPYATISKAMQEGANVIYLAPGEYTEHVYSSTPPDYLKIIGYGASFKPVDYNALEIRVGKWVEIIGVTIDLQTSTAQASGIFLRNCKGVLRDCTVKNTTYMGYRLDGSIVEVINCVADNCTVDGFNGHDTTNRSVGVFRNCKATNCGDDGLSYHEEGTIYVFGGEYASCSSTGIAPHNNCNCVIQDAYIHDNGRAGIEALVGNYTIPDPLPTMVLSGCLFEGNVGNAVTAEHFIVKASANGANGNGTNGIVDDGGSTITTFALIT